MVNVSVSNASNASSSSVVMAVDVVVLVGQFSVQAGGSVLPGVFTSPANTGANRHTVSSRALSFCILMEPPNLG